MFIHLLKWLEDLYSLEHDVLLSANRFAIVDYGVKPNPLLEEALAKDERTIEEM